MTLHLVELSGVFNDGQGNPLSGSVTFQPNTTVYASGIPVLEVDVPITAEVVAGQLRNASGGTLQLLATDNSGLTYAGQTGFLCYSVSMVLAGQVLPAWSFFLPYGTLGAGPADLMSLANTGAGGGGGGGPVDSVFGRTGVVAATSGDYSVGQVTGAAPLASPALTGTPTAPTQTPGDNTTKVATDAFVTAAVATETARATTAEALLAPKASPALTGTPTAPTASALTDNTQVATTAYADAAVAVETTRAETAEGLKAPLASPALTGNPTAPTQAGSDNSTRLATTAYVTGVVGTETTRAEAAEALAAQKSANLSDLASASGARANLGLGSAALLGSAAVAQTANNLSDLASASTARTNLGLGSAATQASSAFFSSAGGAVAGPFSTTPVTLTDAATILVNAAASNFFRVTLGGNRTLGTPANPVDGQAITVEVIQDATGSRTLSYSGAYSFPASCPQPSLSTTASDRDLISFVYDGGVSLWVCTGYVLQQFGALVTIAQGGTGQTSQQAAINALTGVQTSGYYLRSGGTNAVLSAIQAADLPAATTSVQGAAEFDGTAAHILGEGTQIAGANGKSADSGHVHPASSIVPADHGLLAWTYDIDAAAQSVTLIAGTIYLTKIPIRTAMTATTLWFAVGVAGVGVSTGSFVGLYSSAGTLLSGSSDLGTAIAAGSHSQNLTTPQALTAGTFVWAAIVVNQASSQPSLACPYNFTGSARQNINLTAATYRAAVPAGGTTQTALLGSFTPSSNSNTGIAALWFGIS